MSYKEELIMILKNQIITNIKIESVNDLYKLKPFLEDGTLKINKSQIARELEVDRRTVDKYINGYTKPETRNCNDCITPFYDIIAELLSDRNQQVFYYRKVLWQYLVDNHGFTGVYCNFCHYLKKYPDTTIFTIIRFMKFAIFTIVSNKLVMLQDDKSPSGWTLAVYNTKEEADKICVKMNRQSSTKQYEVRQYKRRISNER